MKLMIKIGKNFQPLTVFIQSSILDVWLDFEYVPAFIYLNLRPPQF